MSDLDVVVAGARAALPGEDAIVGADGPEPPRFELFHAPNSICSQKVRVVLAHHGFPYRARALSLFAGDTYRPGYVRLRMMGCGALGPKNLAIADPLATARAVVWLQDGFSRTFRGLIAGLNHAANAIVRRLGIEPAEELRSARSPGQLGTLVRAPGRHAS